MSGIGFPNTANFAYTTIATAASVLATGTTSGAGVVAGSQGPTLNLNFQFSPAGGPVLDPRITFTRGTNATYTNSAGNVQLTAGVNDARFDYDPVTLACKGLLIEEARTNSLTYSEQFDNAVWNKWACSVTANAITSPNGTVTADKLITDNATTGNLYVGTNLTAVSYTVSIFAKAGEWSWILLGASPAANTGVYFNLLSGTVGTQNSGYTGTIQSVGNGWYRCCVTFTATAVLWNTIVFATNADTTLTSGNGTSGIYIWGAQLEAGAFPTSYIPTTTASATRNADNASMTGTNFSSWYNQTQGTFVCKGDIVGGTAATYPHPWSIIGTNNNTDLIAPAWASPSGQLIFAVVVAGVNQINTPFGPTLVAGNTFSQSAAYATNDFAASGSGQAVVTSSSGTLPTTVTLLLGGQSQYQTYWNGHIASISYYPTRLPNATLQALTV